MRPARSPARSSVGKAVRPRKRSSPAVSPTVPLRPSFADGFRNETQIVTTVIGADQHNPHDVLSINAASAALMISGIPFDGPLGSIRMAYSTDGEWIPHPTYEETEAGTFELVVAGRELDNGDVAVMMVEAGGTEQSFYYYDDGAPKVDEAVLADGPRGLQGLDQGIDRPAASARRQRDRHPRSDRRRSSSSRSSTTAPRSTLPSKVSSSGDIAEAVKIADKHERNAATDAASAKALERAVRRRRRVRRPGEGRQGSGSLADQELGPPACDRRGHPPRRPCAPATCVRSRPRSACCRPHTAPDCSSVARPRC